MWHEGLLSKISHILSQSIHLLFQYYLSNRFFRIKVKLSIFKIRSIKAGARRGIMTCLSVRQTHTLTFANDTAVIGSHSYPLEASILLQFYINELEIWLDKWKIRVKPEKFAHETFTLRKNDCNPVKIYSHRWEILSKFTEVCPIILAFKI